MTDEEADPLVNLICTSVKLCIGHSNEIPCFSSLQYLLEDVGE